MPRDLLADSKALNDVPQSSRESESNSNSHAGQSVQMSSDNQFVIVEDHLKKKSIHPFAQLLNREDLDDCDWLEHVAFDPAEAASREKVSSFQLCQIRSFVRRKPRAVLF
jgi:hypothetical protein